MFSFKFTNWMINSVYPDQMATWSGSTLFAKVGKVGDSRISVNITFTTLWVNSADYKLIILLLLFFVVILLLLFVCFFVVVFLLFFLFCFVFLLLFVVVFPENRFDISCETIYKKCQILFSGWNKKKIFKIIKKYLKMSLVDFFFTQHVQRKIMIPIYLGHYPP